MKKNIFVLFSIVLIGITQGCKKVDYECMKGTVIGKIRSSGGGLAVELDKNFKGSVKWQGHKNVIEVLNIPVEYSSSGTTFYFKSRNSNSSEQGPITADGDESIKLVLFGEVFSKIQCP